MATSKRHIIEELQAVRSAKLRALKTGQSVQIPGAVSSEMVPYDVLCRREADLIQKLLRAGNAPRMIRPKYTGYSGTRDWEDS